MIRFYVIRQTLNDKLFNSPMFFNGNYKSIMPIKTNKLDKAKKYKTMKAALKGFELFKFNFGERIAKDYFIDTYTALTHYRKTSLIPILNWTIARMLS